MTLIRSTLFMLWFVTVSVVVNVGMLPTLAMPRSVAMRAPKWWCALSLWGLKWIAGLDYEVRGTVPQDAVLVASKHMSMWDTMAIYLLLPDSISVLKRELGYLPFYGWYAHKIDLIFVDRGGHASALRRMVADARVRMAKGRALLIFPEGHRMAPGAPPDYKPGVAGIYSQLGVACVPVALNSGLFWTGPAGFIKKRGRIVVEFLPAIAPGMKSREFLALLEQRIETAQIKLIAEGRAMLGE
jgi:1-acyl-sn-glycerol-3-phosphate acyltransferase